MSRFCLKNRVYIVVGKNNPAVDAGNVQAALNDMNDGDVLKLKGTFDFGLQGVNCMTEEIIIQGIGIPVIKNAFYGFRFGGDPTAFFSSPTSHPWLEMHHIKFLNPKGAAIAILGTTGGSIHHCDFEGGLLDEQWKTVGFPPLCSYIQMTTIPYSFNSTDIAWDFTVSHCTADGKAYEVAGPSAPARLSSTTWTDNLNPGMVTITPDVNDTLALTVNGDAHEVVIPGDMTGSAALLDSAVWDPNNPITLTPTSNRLKLKLIDPRGTQYVETTFPLTEVQADVGFVLSSPWAEFTVPNTVTIVESVNDVLCLGVNGNEFTMTLPAGTYSKEDMQIQLQNSLEAAAAPARAAIYGADGIYLLTLTIGSSSTITVVDSPVNTAAETLGYTLGQTGTGVDAGEGNTPYTLFQVRYEINAAFGTADIHMSVDAMVDDIANPYLRIRSNAIGSDVSITVVAASEYDCSTLLGYTIGQEAVGVNPGVPAPKNYTLDEMVSTLNQLMVDNTVPVTWEHDGWEPENDFLTFKTNLIGDAASITITAASEDDAASTLEFEVGQTSTGTTGAPGAVEFNGSWYTGAAVFCLCALTDLRLNFIHNNPVNNMLEAILSSFGNSDRVIAFANQGDMGSIGWGYNALIIHGFETFETSVVQNFFRASKDLDIPAGIIHVECSNSLLRGNQVTAYNCNNAITIWGSNNTGKNNRVIGTGYAGMVIMGDAGGTVSENNILDKCEVKNFDSTYDIALWEGANYNTIQSDEIDDEVYDAGVGNVILNGTKLPGVIHREFITRMKTERSQFNAFKRLYNKYC